MHTGLCKTGGVGSSSAPSAGPRSPASGSLAQGAVRGSPLVRKVSSPPLEEVSWYVTDQSAADDFQEAPEDAPLLPWPVAVHEVGPVAWPVAIDGDWLPWLVACGLAVFRFSDLWPVHLGTRGRALAALACGH